MSVSNATSRTSCARSSGSTAGSASFATSTPTGVGRRVRTRRVRWARPWPRSGDPWHGSRSTRCCSTDARPVPSHAAQEGIASRGRAVPQVDGPPVDGPELRRLAALGWSAAGLPTASDGVRGIDETVGINYPDEGLAHLGLDGGRGYWFDHRARSVVDVLEAATPVRTIWDVGAGAGSMAVRPAQAGYEVVSVEPQRVGAAAIAELRCSAVFCGSLESLQLPAHAIGVVGLFDVIEHLDDPGALIGEVTRVLEAAGVVVVTVPALPLLWSNTD